MASAWAIARTGVAWAATIVAAGATTPHTSAQAAAAGTPTNSSSVQIAVRLGQPEVELKGLWRYRAGDDLRWAQPSWPDASWQTIDPDSDREKDHPVAPFAWVRRAVHIERSSPGQTLALYVRAQDTYEVYWNGRKIGSQGEVPPRFNFPYHEARAFALPLGNAPVTDAMIAIRYWCRLPYSIAMDCGLGNTPFIGDLSMEQDELQGSNARTITRNLALTGSGIPTLLAGLLALAGCLRRRDRVLFLAGALLICVAAQNLIDGLPHVLSNNWGDGVYSFANFGETAASLLLVAGLLGILARPRLGRAIQTVALGLLAWGVLDGILAVFEAHIAHWMQILDGISVFKDFVGSSALILVVATGLRSPAWKRKLALHHQHHRLRPDEQRF